MNQSINYLLIPSITLIFAMPLSGCAQEKAKRMIRGPSVTVLVPESPNENGDGISQIIFGEIFKEGETEYTRVGSRALSNAPPLPTGHVLFKDLAFHVKTQAVTAGSNLTVFNLRSVENESDFDRISVLHLEDDEMSPSGRSWAPVLVFPDGWQEHFRQISKAQYEAALPDFKLKRLSAITARFGVFVITLAPESQADATDPFTTIEVQPSNSPDPVPVGGEVTQNIVVKNKGPKSAAEVNLKEEFHTDFDYVSVTSSQGTCKRSDRSSGRILCHLGQIPAGAAATIKIALRVRRNLSWGGNESLGKLLSIIELVFKERSTDFVVMDNQIFKEYTTTIIRDR